MKKVRVGIVGFGFIGPHHLDAIRRLGFAEVVALATSDAARAEARAREYMVPRGYGDWRELVTDPEVDVVDIATPTHLHAEIALAAIRAGKHVIVDKPLALNSAEARTMLQAARKAGVVHAVTFNIRYNILVLEARARVARGDVGEVRFVRGHYLQEFLLTEDDFNWRVEPGKAGALAMVADAGAHWYDMAEQVTGRRIVKVLADLATFIPARKKPLPGGGVEDYPATVPDLGTVLCQFDNGARGVFTASAVCAGHRNDLTLEVCGSRASIRWEQERPNELWLGYRGQPNACLLKDPELLDPSVKRYAALPGGHNEAWTDAFRNLMRDILRHIADGGAGGADFPTFSTGLRVASIADAVAASAAAGGVWTDVAAEESA